MQNPFAGVIEDRFAAHLACTGECGAGTRTRPLSHGGQNSLMARLDCSGLKTRKTMIRHAGRAGWGLHNASSLVLASVAPLQAPKISAGQGMSRSGQCGAPYSRRSVADLPWRIGCRRAQAGLMGATIRGDRSGFQKPVLASCSLAKKEAPSRRLFA